MPGLNNLFNTLTGRGINNKDAHGETRLLKAVRQGSLNEVKRLLKNGADPETRDARGLTALHIAAYWGETDIVEALIKAGADVNSDNGKGWTPLHAAALSGGLRCRKEIIALLIKAGADGDKTDGHGWSPRNYMQLWEENTAAAEKLKEYMAMKQANGQNTASLQRHKPPAPQ